MSRMIARRFRIGSVLHDRDKSETFFKPMITLPPASELELQSTATPNGLADTIALGPADFQRIGIQPNETRLAVIRRAASRTAKSLATRQLTAPTPRTELQLSRVTLSTYRLLDPRQRNDRYSRAHVGRIRPGDLHEAGRTEFADGALLKRRASHTLTSDGSNRTTDQSSSVPGPPIVAGHCRDKQDLEEPIAGWTAVTSADKAVEFAFPPVESGPTVAKQIRGQAENPRVIITMILILLVTAVALWNSGVA